jgi:hypothetical protein
MARPDLADQEGVSGSLVMPGFLLLMECLFWIAVISLFTSYSTSVGSTVLDLVPVVLLAVGVVAIVLLVKAPRRGLWLGLGLQVAAALDAGALLFFWAPLFGLIGLAFAAVTAWALVSALPSRQQS